MQSTLPARESFFSRPKRSRQHHHTTLGLALITDHEWRALLLRVNLGRQTLCAMPIVSFDA